MVLVTLQVSSAVLFVGKRNGIGGSNWDASVCLQLLIMFTAQYLT